MFKQTLDKQDGDVRFREFETTHGKIYINVCKDLNLVVINKEFKASGFKHHLELTIEEFNELKKIEV